MIKTLIPDLPLLILLIYESISLIILFFVFSFITDNSYCSLIKKISNNLKIASIIAGISGLVFILSKALLPFNVYFNAIINYFIFAFFACVPLLRDVLIYKKFNKSNFIANVTYVPFFLFFKAIMNLISMFIISDQIKNITSYTGLFIFSMIIIILNPLILSFFVKGFIKHNNKLFPVYNIFKIGKTNESDIKINIKEIKKRQYLNISTKHKWKIIPFVEIELNQKKIKKVKEINHDDKIKIFNHNFLIIKNRKSYLKKFYIILSTLFLLLITTSSKNKYDWELIKSQDIYIANIDYSLHKLINIYIKLDNDTINKLKNEDSIFIIEGDKAVKIEKIEKKIIPINLIFILDKTGSMADEYRVMHRSLNDLQNNLKSIGRDIKVSLITFSDYKKDMDFYDLTDDIDSCINFMRNIKPGMGFDIPENPYEAIYKIKDIDFDLKAEKVAILFTDAPPHIKGDKDYYDIEYTNKLTNDIQAFINESSILLYIVSNNEYLKYKRIINFDKNKFFDINKYSHFSEILKFIEIELKNHIKISYYSKKPIDFYKNEKNIYIFIDEDAVKAKKLYNKANNQNDLKSFYKSIFDIF